MHSFFWLYLTINDSDFLLIPLDRNTYKELMYHTFFKCITLQVTDVGDIFQQTLSPSPDDDTELDKTATPGPGFNKSRLSAESNKICRKWLNKALPDERQKNTAPKQLKWHRKKVPRKKTLEGMWLFFHTICIQMLGQFGDYKKGLIKCACSNPQSHPPLFLEHKEILAPEVESYLEGFMCEVACARSVVTIFYETKRNINI